MEEAFIYCAHAAGSGLSVHPGQSDPPSSGRPEEVRAAGAASVCSEDGGSASGVLLPAAARPSDRRHAPHQHGENSGKQEQLVINRLKNMYVK